MASGQGNTSIHDLLNKIFQNTALPWDANVLLYVSLHTASPVATGNQTTFEASYTGYSRVAVSRTSGGWTLSGQQMSNAGAITFGTASTAQTITDVGIGTAASGAGELLFFGTLNSSLSVVSGTIPTFPIGSLIVLMQ